MKTYWLFPGGATVEDDETAQNSSSLPGVVVESPSRKYSKSGPRDVSGPRASVSHPKKKTSGLVEDPSSRGYPEPGGSRDMSETMAERSHPKRTPFGNVTPGFEPDYSAESLQASSSNVYDSEVSNQSALF